MRPARLHPDDLAEPKRTAVGAQQSAKYVAPIAAGAQYASAAQLAVRYGGRSLPWVRSHALDFGATPLSDAANSKLTYHLATADAWMAARQRRREAIARGRSGGRQPKAPAARTHTPSGQLRLRVV